jgi:hypothetical protein
MVQITGSVLDNESVCRWRHCTPLNPVTHRNVIASATCTLKPFTYLESCFFSKSAWLFQLQRFQLVLSLPVLCFNGQKCLCMAVCIYPLCTIMNRYWGFQLSCKVQSLFDDRWWRGDESCAQNLFKYRPVPCPCIVYVCFPHKERS